jgi:hypothetical protein
MTFVRPVNIPVKCMSCGLDFEIPRSCLPVPPDYPGKDLLDNILCGNCRPKSKKWVKKYGTRWADYLESLR